MPSVDEIFCAGAGVALGAGVEVGGSGVDDAGDSIVRVAVSVLGIGVIPTVGVGAV